MRVSENPQFDADFKTSKKLQNYSASDTIRLYIPIYICIIREDVNFGPIIAFYILLTVKMWTPTYFPSMKRIFCCVMKYWIYKRIVIDISFNVKYRVLQENRSKVHSQETLFSTVFLHNVSKGLEREIFGENLIWPRVSKF
jgi:hypothetical protein